MLAVLWFAGGYQQNSSVLLHNWVKFWKNKNYPNLWKLLWHWQNRVVLNTNGQGDSPLIKITLQESKVEYFFLS